MSDTFRPTAGAAVAITFGLALAACSPGTRMAGPEPLGMVDFATSCDPAVRDDFNRALAYLHHMTYPVAAASLQSITERDPECGIAYWAWAMTLFQPLWPTRPSASDLSRGWDLLAVARRRVGTPRESSFVAAGEAFFDPSGDPDYWTRIDRWAAATEATYSAYPSDLDAAALYALSRLAVSDGSADPAAGHAEAAAVLLTVLAVQPDHPGAVHYTIHANDFNGREHESLDVVRRYSEIAPHNAHALHMPTHIFVRLGEWQTVIDGDRRAAEAALTQRVGPLNQYVWDEFPHAVEYMVYAQLQQGDDDAAAEMIRILGATPDLQPSFKTAFHFASTATRFALERQAWEAAASLPVRQPVSLEWDRFPWPEALVWYARGLGAAHMGQTQGVEESLEHLAALSASATGSGETLFADQIEILELEVRAWRSLGRSESSEAVAAMNRAVSLERRTPKHPVTPGAALPAGELLGDLYLVLGQPELARDAYAESNADIPGRLNTLVGLARTSLALGDTASASIYYAEMLSRTSPSSRRPGVIEARAFSLRR